MFSLKSSSIAPGSSWLGSSPSSLVSELSGIVFCTDLKTCYTQIYNSNIYIVFFDTQSSF